MLTVICALGGWLVSYVFGGDPTKVPPSIAASASSEADSLRKENVWRMVANKQCRESTTFGRVCLLVASLRIVGHFAGISLWGCP